MADILTVATARTRPEQRQGGSNRYPRVDYVELKRALGNDFLNYDFYENGAVGRLLRHLETQVHSDLYLALASLVKQRGYSATFAMSERVGIPLAALKRFRLNHKPLIAMFHCWSSRQERMITHLKLFDVIDQIIVHCRSMKELFVRLGARPDRVHVIHYGIDQRFFTPLPNARRNGVLLFSAGEVRSRDYPSLFAAVAELPIQMVVAASGRWYAREKNRHLRANVPPNTTVVNGLSAHAIRQFYARSRFVILPVQDGVYSAGSTVALEAMCMGRPVVAFGTPGIRDYVFHGETGLLVEPGNVQALRDAICHLLSRPDEVERMGHNARRRAETELNMDRYVGNITRLLHDYLLRDGVAGRGARNPVYS